MNLLPIINIPEVHALKAPKGLLYYYDLETEGDLARLMRYLLFTGAMSLSLHGECEAVFKAGNSFYRVKVETDTFCNNPFAVSFVTLYELEDEYLDRLVDWSRAVDLEDETEYDFNYIWTSLTGGPIGYQHAIVNNPHLYQLLPDTKTCLNWLEEKNAFKSVLGKLPVDKDLMDGLLAQ